MNILSICHSKCSIIDYKNIFNLFPNITLDNFHITNCKEYAYFKDDGIYYLNTIHNIFNIFQQFPTKYLNPNFIPMELTTNNSDIKSTETLNNIMNNIKKDAQKRYENLQNEYLYRVNCDVLFIEKGQLFYVNDETKTIDLHDTNKDYVSYLFQNDNQFYQEYENVYQATRNSIILNSNNNKEFIMIAGNKNVFPCDLREWKGQCSILFNNKIEYNVETLNIIKELHNMNNIEKYYNIMAYGLGNYNKGYTPYIRQISKQEYLQLQLI